MKMESVSMQQPLSSQSAPANSDLEMYAHFTMKGCVSLEDGGPQVPVAIWCDTAASQSVILEAVLPLSCASSVSSDVLVRMFGMRFVGVPCSCGC